MCQFVWYTIWSWVFWRKNCLKFSCLHQSLSLLRKHWFSRNFKHAPISSLYKFFIIWFLESKNVDEKDKALHRYCGRQHWEWQDNFSTAFHTKFQHWSVSWAGWKMAQFTRTQFVTENVWRSFQMVNVASNLHSIDYGTATQPTLSETGQDHGAITVKASTRVFNICWMFFFQFLLCNFSHVFKCSKLECLWILVRDIALLKTSSTRRKWKKVNI